ncbi:MAG: hypothetical protein R3E39_23985 [Anaerolineae bacterium]
MSKALISYSHNDVAKLSRHIIVGIAILGFVILAIIVSDNKVIAQSQNERQTFSDYLSYLDKERIPFYLGFDTPILGDSGWDIPDRYEENGVIYGGKRLSQIGEDFICIEEWGQGITTIYCIPFSNISSVQHYPGAVAQK